jgi:hypothetical protein
MLEDAMNAIVNRFSASEREVPEIRTALAKWYAAHSSIRRLWAIDDPVALIVLVTLEPTSDNDDTLPVWLAMKRDWTNHLKSLVNREVQLRLTVAGAFEDSYVNTNAAVIAELSWRDSWVST